MIDKTQESIAVLDVDETKINFETSEEILNKSVHVKEEVNAGSHYQNILYSSFIKEEIDIKNEVIEDDVENEHVSSFQGPLQENTFCDTTDVIDVTQESLAVLDVDETKMKHEISEDMLNKSVHVKEEGKAGSHYENIVYSSFIKEETYMKNEAMGDNMKNEHVSSFQGPLQGNTYRGRTDVIDLTQESMVVLDVDETKINSETSEEISNKSVHVKEEEYAGSHYQNILYSSFIKEEIDIKNEVIEDDVENEHVSSFQGPLQGNSFGDRTDVIDVTQECLAVLDVDETKMKLELSEEMLNKSMHVKEEGKAGSHYENILYSSCIKEEIDIKNEVIEDDVENEHVSSFQEETEEDDEDEEIDVVSISKENSPLLSFPNNPSLHDCNQIYMTIVSAMQIPARVGRRRCSASPMPNRSNGPRPRSSTGRRRRSANPMPKRSTDPRPRRTTGNRRYRHPAKRSMHNNMERQRTIDMRNLVLELQSVIPTIARNVRVPKVQILKAAATYCRELHAQDIKLDTYKEDLRRKQAQLRLKLSHLHFHCIYSTIN